MADEDYVPRRLKRFQRREEEAKEKAGEEKKGKPYVVVEKPKGEKEPSFFEKLFGKKKPAADVAEPAPPEPRAQSLERKRKEIEEIKAKLAKEVKGATVESMAEEIYTQIERKPGKPRSEVKKAEARQMTLKELREFRRKYKRLPSKDEYASIADSVISQLKAPAEKAGGVAEEKGEKAEEAPAAAAGKRLSPRERIAAMRAARQEKKGPSKTVLPPEGKPKRPTPKEREEKEASIKELLGEDEDIPSFEEEAGEKIEPLPEFGEEEDEDVEAIEEDKGKCANCGAPAEEKVYCPECGSEFCDRCAAEKQAMGAFTKYKCPVCGKDFKKKKR